MADDWIGVQEAAELLDVSRQMVHKLITSGALPGKRLSERGAWMLQRPDVVALPTKQVLALAEKAANGKDGELRHMSDMAAVLARLPDADVVELVKKVRLLAAKEEEQGTGSVAERYRGIADWMDALKP